MSDRNTYDPKADKRRHRSVPYTLPSRLAPQHPSAPRQVPELPQSSANLQKHVVPPAQQSTSNRYHAVAHPPAHASSSKNPSTPSAPTTRARKYSRKRALLIWFKNHDFKQDALNKEINDVVELFEKRLGFDPAQRCAILETGTSPTDQLIDTLQTFIKACKDKDELLVVYYSGHGGARKGGGLKLQSRGKVQGSSQTVYWNRLQKEVLFQANADVLVLLDCCHAEMGVKGLHNYRRDAIAACASDRTTEWPGERSFTACLINAVDVLLPGGFTANQLHAKIKEVAAVKWQDGATRAEVPIYHQQCGDATNHEIYFEGSTSNSNPTTSKPLNPAPGTSAPVRLPSSPRRGPQVAVALNENDDSTSESTSDDEDEAKSQAETSAAIWQQRRVQAQGAYSRLRAAGHPHEQAIVSLINTWQSTMGLSRQDAQEQIRRLLARQ